MSKLSGEQNVFKKSGAVPMTNALALKQDIQFSRDEMELITATIAKNATPKELELFIYRCKEMGLNPLKPGQIHFVKYANGPGTIVVGIEGFRSLAARTGMMSGIKRGVLKDEKGKLVGAWCEVFRKDWDEPAREEVPFEEYNTGRPPWTKMPETMIKKVAEAAALRMAFPDNLGGVYAQEEMYQAEEEQERKREQGARLGLETLPSVKPQDTYEADLASGGIVNNETEGEYTVPNGKFARKTIKELFRDPKIGPTGVQNYIEWMEAQAVKKNVEVSGWAVEFISEASRELALLEQGPEHTEQDLPF